MRAIRRSGALAACVALALLCSAQRSASADDVIETFTGTVVGTGGVLGGQSVPFTLRVYRFATPEEARRLSAAYSDGGSQALLRALRKIKKMGILSIDGRVGYEVGAIFNGQAGDRRQIVVVTARPISQFELRNATRSRDYPFSVLEMNLDADGKGEGIAVAAAKIVLNEGGGITVENFNTYELKLLGVRKR